MATINDVYNLLNGNGPYPGDAPQLYATLVSDVEGYTPDIPAILANQGFFADPSNPDIATYLSKLFTDINAQIKPVIGGPTTPGDTLFNLLYPTKSDAHSAYTNTNTLLTNLSTLDVAVGYTAHSPATLYADIQTIKTGLSGQASTLATLLGDIVAVQTTLANVALGIVASWPKSGVGNLVQSIGDFLLGQSAGPGTGHLTIGSATAITAGALVSKPTGAYGLQLNLSVPGHWGKIDTAPDVFIPAVARLAQFSTWGTAGTPLPIETAFPTIYPLHPACSQVSIELGVGVTGTRAWLLLT